MPTEGVFIPAGNAITADWTMTNFAVGPYVLRACGTAERPGDRNGANACINVDLFTGHRDHVGIIDAKSRGGRDVGRDQHMGATR